MGLGYTSQFEDIGAVMVGRDKYPWKVVVKSGVKIWCKLPVAVKEDTNIGDADRENPDPDLRKEIPIIDANGDPDIEAIELQLSKVRAPDVVKKAPRKKPTKKVVVAETKEAPGDPLSQDENDSPSPPPQEVVAEVMSSVKKKAIRKKVVAPEVDQVPSGSDAEMDAPTPATATVDTPQVVKKRILKKKEAPLPDPSPVEVAQVMDVGTLKADVPVPVLKKIVKKRIDV